MTLRADSPAAEQASHSSRQASRLPILASVRSLARRPRLAIGVVGLSLLVIVAVFAPLVARSGPLAQNLTIPLHAPSAAHPLGTDALGRDELTRTIYAARTSLALSGIAVLLAIGVGTFMGLISGWFGGIVDEVLMGVVEVFVSFPFILLAIVIVAWLGASTWHTMLALAVTGWVALARVVRAQTLSLRAASYVEAARTIGCSVPRILVRHILPQTVSNITVIGTLEVSRMMLLEGGLSFLGLGVPLPTPSWGNMLAEGKNHISDAWWLTTFPGLALLLAVLVINQLGDGLRDFFDPTLRGR